MGVFLLVEAGKNALEKRQERQRADRAQDGARGAAHDARRAQALTEASEVKVERARREGKTMAERSRDLLGLARDLLKRDGSGNQ